MADCRIPNAWEAGLLRANDMDPDKFAVLLHGDSYVILLNYKTRCTIRIDKGDQEWCKGKNDV